MPIPTPNDVRELLEGYGIDERSTAILTGELTAGSPIVKNIDTTILSELYDIEGAGIPAYTQIKSLDVIDPLAGEFTMTDDALESGVKSLTFVVYPCLSNKWIVRERDKFIIPWIEAKTRKSFSAVKQVTEYYSGTGSSLLILRNRPIVSLDRLGYTNVDTNFYYLSPNAVVPILEEGIIKAKANFNESSYIPIFYKGDRNIKVTYSYGYADMPDDVQEAVSHLLAERALGHIGSKTGGGDLVGEKYSRAFGARGKWTHIRNDLARSGMSLLKRYMTGVTS